MIPEEGNPLSPTLPVTTEQVGCTGVPGTGGGCDAYTVRVAAFDVALFAVQFVI